jgi:small redox-active disulfide protein 2
MKIEVLGTGCRKCSKAADAILSIGNELNVDFELEKVTDPSVMMHYQVLSTPAIAINGKLVHSGSVPGSDLIRSWLT